MVSLEIPRVEVNPDLIDPYDEAIRATWVDGPTSCRIAPSPQPFMVGAVDLPTFMEPIDLRPFNSGDDMPYDRSSVERLKIPINFEDGIVIYQVPEGLEQFHEAIKVIGGHEHSHYPAKRPTLLQATIDQTPVDPGTSQRGGEGSQKVYLHRDLMFDHIYGVSNVGTVHLVSEESIEEQPDVDPANPETLYKGMTVYQARPGEVVQSNALSVHASAIIEEGGDRTYLKLAFRYFRPVPYEYL